MKNETNDPERDEGIKAIIFLQGMAGITEPEAIAAENWDRMTQGERDQTMRAYRTFNREPVKG